MKWKTIMIIKLRQMNFVFGLPKQGNLISIKYDEKLQISEMIVTSWIKKKNTPIVQKYSIYFW